MLGRPEISSSLNLLRGRKTIAPESPTLAICKVLRAGSRATCSSSSSLSAAVDAVLSARAALEREAGGSSADSRPVDDEELILEVNGTSSGLMPDCADEDNQHIRDVVLAKMMELWS